MPSPVIGDIGGLFPRIEVSVCIDTDMTNDPIEEELRLSISMISLLIHFRHHKAPNIWQIWVGIGFTDLCEIMGMKLAASFLHFSLERICFFL